MTRHKDLDDWYMEYADLVEAGEIDPTKISDLDWVNDRLCELADFNDDEIFQN